MNFIYDSCLHMPGDGIHMQGDGIHMQGNGIHMQGDGIHMQGDGIHSCLKTELNEFQFSPKLKFLIWTGG